MVDMRYLSPRAIKLVLAGWAIVAAIVILWLVH